MKYCNEKNDEAVSRAVFYRLKPFWSLKPKFTGRDTCLCKDHENIKFMLHTLYKNKIISSNSCREVIESLCCYVNKEKCMFRQCTRCKVFKVPNNNSDQLTEYNSWVTEKVTRPGAKGLSYSVKITSKKK